MKSTKTIFWLVILIQLVLIGMYPLMDTTEARYADIARRMYDLQDWITPWFDNHQPFWGKPPLSFWLTMLGYKLFGINEFGARFFIWVTSLGVLLVTFKTAKLYLNNNVFYTPAILLSFLLFYISSTAVMTDIPLLMGAVIVLYAQLNMSIKGANSKSLNSSLLGIGLGIGMLAKGPISLILFVTPLLFWACFKSNYQTIRKGLVLWQIALITFLISAPWYFLAEMRTPGFLNYFIIGEHWNRYLVPGWQGDLYGSAHDFPRGSMWLFFIVATLPWSLVLLVTNLRAKFKKVLNDEDFPNDVKLLLVLWILIPLIFFSLSGNVLWTYVLPCLPATAIIIAVYLSKSFQDKFNENLIQISLCTVLIVKICLLIYVFTSDKVDQITTKYLVHDIQQLKIPLNHVYFNEKIPFSARFYSQGQIKELTDESLSKQGSDSKYFVVKKIKRADFLNSSKCNKVVLQNGKYQVLSCN
jgi:4-amino-4-deoxy-L-arabinose transferase-like glycosyltransferase